MGAAESYSQSYPPPCFYYGNDLQPSFDGLGITLDLTVTCPQVVDQIRFTEYIGASVRGFLLIPCIISRFRAIGLTLVILRS